MSERKSQWELFLEEEAAKDESSLETKRCTKCKKIKPLSGYYRRGLSRYKSACKECISEYKRKNRKHKFRNRQDRFWKHYWLRVVRVGECLEWVGAYNSGGRAPENRWDKKKTPVRRIVYRLAIGDLPDDMFVFMTCGNRRCVSQHHMTLGSVEDVRLKAYNSTVVSGHIGRHTHPEIRGERNTFAKLTEPAVRNIRRRFLEGESRVAIAESVGVSYSTVHRIISGKLWSHVQ